MKHIYDVERKAHVWTFGGDVAELVFVVPQPDHPTFATAALHGYKQKIGDAAALVRSTETGKTATDAEKRAAMQTIVDRILVEELWNAERSGERKIPPIDVDALVAAIVALRGKEPVAARAWVESKPEDVRFALAMGDEFRLEYALAVVKKSAARPVDAGLGAELDGL